MGRWLYELTVIRSITIATLVINHCRGHYLGLHTRVLAAQCTATYNTHFWRSFELYRFLSTKRKGYARRSLSPRDGKIRKPSARISAALICFVCIARYANTKRRATKQAQWRIKVQKDARKFRLTNRAT